MRVLTTLLILITIACSKLQGQALPASTGCIAGVDTAVTIFRPDVQKDTAFIGQLEVHEAIHRAQVKALMADTSKGKRDCFEAFLFLTSSPEVNLESEIPAYRAQAQWLREKFGAGFDEDRFYELTAKRLYFAYNHALPNNYIEYALRLGHRPEQFREKPTFPDDKSWTVWASNPDSEIWQNLEVQAR